MTAQVSLPPETDAPAHAELPDGDDEAQEGQEPRQEAGGRRGQRLLHLLPSREVLKDKKKCMGAELLSGLIFVTR